MNNINMTALAVAGAILGVALFASVDPRLKTILLGVGGVMVAKQTPFVQQYM